jgi:polyhydroxyalkanoate synthase
MVDNRLRGQHQDTLASQMPAFPEPEAIMGAWTSWIEAVSKLWSSQGPAATIPGQGSGPEDVLGHGLRAGSVHQLGEWLSKDPILLASEKALNANPLRQVIPIDWAGIAAALRTVWLHQLTRPDTAIAAAMEFNRKLAQSIPWLIENPCALLPSGANRILPLL